MMNLLHEMNDPSMFCNDQFPQLPEFPCMSSSSSSSSNPAPAKPICSATTTSTASSMSPSVLETADGSGTIDCMDVMENYGYMDLIDGNDIWDPTPIFEQNPPDLLPESEVVEKSEMKDGGGGGGGGGGGEGGSLDELGAVFFEWLKSNKEFISAEDMRKIKIKRSTVECASKRLGSSKEGKKQLLKLILEWVQQHQLQRKNSGGGGGDGGGDTTTTAALYPFHPQGNFHGLGLIPPTPVPPPPPFNCGSWAPCGEISNGLSPPPWIQPYTADTGGGGVGMAMVAPRVEPSSAFSYMGGDYDSGLNSQLNPYFNMGSVDYRLLESTPSWNPSQITMSSSPFHNQSPHVVNNYAPQIMPAFPDQFSYNAAAYIASGGGKHRLTGLGPSATKEARKKRMARQRRTYFHHHSKHHQNNDHNQVTSSDHHHDHHHAQAMLVDDNSSSKSHGGNWFYWPSPPPTNTVPPLPIEAPQQTSSRPHQSSDHLSPQTSPDKLPTEKNLKFLLQKVLKQSDVGSLGRIVMPKKEAECHLPELDSRDGITIPMEDIGTSQVWNMRYRFWPNNKSRMYLLENTGDFVKANGLQEGDFIVLYSNVKCGKYLIRGVKVRQPASSGKPEVKKPTKRSYRSSS